jgi:hypothetical protein
VKNSTAAVFQIVHRADDLDGACAFQFGQDGAIFTLPTVISIFLRATALA